MTAVPSTERLLCHTLRRLQETRFRRRTAAEGGSKRGRRLSPSERTRWPMQNERRSRYTKNIRPPPLMESYPQWLPTAATWQHNSRRLMPQ